MTTPDENPPNLIGEALETILKVLGNQDVVPNLGGFDFLMERQGILVVFSSHGKDLKTVLMLFAEWVYDDEGNSDDTFNNNIQYIFVPQENPGPAFWSMARLFEHLSLGRVVSISSLVSELFSYQVHDVAITRSELQQELEIRSFPGGYSEIVEICSRNPDFLHKLIGIFRDGQTQESGHHDVGMTAAIRTLFGAWCTYEIDDKLFGDAIESLATWTNDNNDHKFIENFKSRLYDQGQLALPKKFDVNKNYPKQTVPLSHFVNGRTILVIEDKLNDDGWDVTLPYLLGSYVKIEKEQEYETFQISNGDNYSFRLIHFKTIRQALNWLDDQNWPKRVNEIDLVLLDLYSSNLSIAGHPSSHSAGIPHPVWQLTSLLKNKKRKVKKRKIKGADPQKRRVGPGIVAFTAEDEPMSIHNLSKELGITHFFFKKTATEGHKSAYFSSFKNTIISALSGSICEHLNIPALMRDNRFNRWLQQFDWEDRPIVLRLMQHFHFFSAMDIVFILNTYFEKRFAKNMTAQQNHRPRP